MGRAVSEPVGDRWRRRDVLRHLDAEHLRAGGHAGVGHDDTEGRVYAMSSEHHVRYEVQLRNAQRTGGSTRCRRRKSAARAASPCRSRSRRRATSPSPTSTSTASSARTSRSPTPSTSPTRATSGSGTSTATATARWRSTRRCGTFRRARRSAQREFAWLTVSGAQPAAGTTARPKAPSPVIAPGAGCARSLAASSTFRAAPIDAAGDFYFVDARWQRIYRWSAVASRLSTVSDAPLDPVNLAFDKAGNLLVVSYAGNGTVFAFKPGDPAGSITRLAPVDASPRPGLTIVRPVGEWRVARDQATGRPVAEAVSLRLAGRQHVPHRGHATSSRAQ